MTAQQSHAGRLKAIAKDHWRKFESDVEHQERVDAAERVAGWSFNRATVRQQAAWNLAMSDLRGLVGPKYDRAREAAKEAWFASTAEARTLLEQTVECILRDGEISSELDDAWTALLVTAEMMEEAGEMEMV